MTERFVDFEKYCKTCKNKNKGEDEDPCWDCLEIPAREDSRKPEHYEEEN